MSLRQLSLRTQDCVDFWRSCFIGKTKDRKWCYDVRCSRQRHSRVCPEFFTHGRALSLSHTQKGFIVKHGCLDKNRDLFLKHMMVNPNIPCSDQQIAATQEFERAIFNFLTVNSRYLQPSHEIEITLNIFLEILELLKASPQERGNK